MLPRAGKRIDPGNIIPVPKTYSVSNKAHSFISAVLQQFFFHCPAVIAAISFCSCVYSYASVETDAAEIKQTEHEGEDKEWITKKGIGA